jgi:TonB family protein|tara:strand:- start:57 stop:434 length:378 start_codon:yes stop_codon:yes gene_type:complete
MFYNRLSLGELPMKKLLTILFSLNVLLANSPAAGNSQTPKPIKPFKLSYYDFRESIYADTDMTGQVIVEFIINKKGMVIKPNIVDTFNITFNDVILDKVRQMRFTPPIQNGEAISVRYKLPITFK